MQQKSASQDEFIPLLVRRRNLQPRRSSCWERTKLYSGLHPKLLTYHRRIPWFDKHPYYCKYRNMDSVTAKKRAERVAKYADMFSAMGTEPRLRIMQLLLSAHPEGLVVGDIQRELEIPNSTLSHHLDKLKNEDLVRVQRESTFLRYTANTEALQELLQFLYSECCTRNKALKTEDIVEICG